MSAEQKWAIPKKGINVRFPISKAILPEAGGYVPWIGPEGRYWRRRLREGSITILDKAPVPVESKIYDGGKK